jgi:hypothetical protein
MNMTADCPVCGNSDYYGICEECDLCNECCKCEDEFDSGNMCDCNDRF